MDPPGIWNARTGIEDLSWENYSDLRLPSSEPAPTDDWISQVTLERERNGMDPLTTNMYNSLWAAERLLETFIVNNYPERKVMLKALVAQVRGYTQGDLDNWLFQDPELARALEELGFPGRIE